MKMNIWRYAVVTLKGTPPPMAPMTIGEADIRPAKSGIVSGEFSSFLLEAHTPHNGVLPTEIDQIVIPPGVYKPLQEGIELYVNMLAVQMRTGRMLASPALYAAIEPADEAAKAWLGAYKHIKREVLQRPHRIWPRVEPRRHLPLLLDRLDGLSLLAEALCHEHPTGRLHELMRLFERAFACGPTKVCKRLLPAVLEPAGFGFLPDEVENWLNLRDRSVHADRRNDFALESETYPVINRVEQAAYDVLFNKASWRDETTTRRDVFHPWFAAADACGETAVLCKGGDINIELSPLDGFGAYPFFMKHYGPELPSGWVVPEGSFTNRPTQLAGGCVLVREDPQAVPSTEAVVEGATGLVSPLLPTTDPRI